ncbi:FHA domain protein [Ruminiclostridium hungatei]|uniref:FHA domain protein n=1 Tax=Ruminiclostridium hungatei TaxID=48256 RepID=A0A1V4SSK7_RUMHU|nr:DUF6382 domain-containing protein [Ruminiclostridium hungatei]OPX46281.1 FHA domain protein [Ruminiclostridium hungatei]
MAEGFAAAFENSAAASYLVLSTKDNSNILDYQVQMLLSNRIGGLLEFNINYTGNDLNCFYNITSKCTLVNYMSRRKFKRNEFLMLLLNVTNNICHIKNYLLYESNVLLDERYIYADPEKEEFYFVYLPFSSYKNDYKAFFLKLVIELSGFYEEESDNYLQKLLEEIKSDLFSLSALRTRLETLLGYDDRAMSETVRDIKAAIKKNAKSDNSETSGEMKPQERSVQRLYTGKETRNIKIPVKSNHSRQSNQSNQSNQSKPENDKNTQQSVSGRFNGQATVFLLLQPVFITAYILSLSSGVLFTGDRGLPAAAIAFIIVACIDILIFRLIKERYKNAAGLDVSGVISHITGKMKAGSQNTGSGPGRETSRMHQQQSDKKQDIRSPAVYNGETEILIKPGIQANAYFKEEEGELVLALDKNSILIGRMENFVDAVVDSSAVGKIHAEVIREAQVYYLVDCNSRNGTYINEKRLLPNTRSPLSNNDAVRFANREFRFFYTGIPEEEGR